MLSHPNQADRFGVTPMMLAASRGYVPIMQFICQTNHDVYAVDKKGHNALHHAAISDQVKSISFLVEHGFLVDQPQSPLLESKIKKCGKRTALQLATVKANEQAFFELIRLGANPEQEDANGNNVCEYGISSKNKDMQNLIKLLPSYHDPKRNTSLLHAAVIADETVIVSELILSHANLNAIDSSGKNALHYAAKYNSGHVAKLLLTGNNMIIDAFDHHGFTPLHYAAANGHVHLIKQLENADADLNLKTSQSMFKENIEGESALTLACLNGHEGAVAALLQLGADYSQKNSHDMTPAQIALLKGNYIIVGLLQEAGDGSLQEKYFVHLDQTDQKSLKSALTMLGYVKKNAPINPLLRFYKPVDFKSAKIQNQKNTDKISSVSIKNK
jgi:ankyrin repeat protein